MACPGQPGHSLIYSFNLLPEPDHHRPAFINLQQYYFEQRMIERATALLQIEIRWQHQASDVAVFDDHIEVAVETPAGIGQSSTTTSTPWGRR